MTLPYSLWQSSKGTAGFGQAVVRKLADCGIVGDDTTPVGKVLDCAEFYAIDADMSIWYIWFVMKQSFVWKKENKGKTFFFFCFWIFVKIDLSNIPRRRFYSHCVGHWSFPLLGVWGRVSCSGFRLGMLSLQRPAKQTTRTGGNQPSVKAAGGPRPRQLALISKKCQS